MEREELKAYGNTEGSPKKGTDMGPSGFIFFLGRLGKGGNRKRGKGRCPARNALSPTTAVEKKREGREEMRWGERDKENKVSLAILTATSLP